MELAYTKKLLEYIGVKAERVSEEIDQLFGWTANLIVVNRRKILAAVHKSSRCTFMLYGVPAKLLPKLPERIKMFQSCLRPGIRGNKRADRFSGLSAFVHIKAVHQRELISCSSLATQSRTFSKAGFSPKSIFCICP